MRTNNHDQCDVRAEMLNRMQMRSMISVCGDARLVLFPTLTIDCAATYRLQRVRQKQRYAGTKSSGKPFNGRT